MDQALADIIIDQFQALLFRFGQIDDDFFPGQIFGKGVPAGFLVRFGDFAVMAFNRGFRLVLRLAGRLGQDQPRQSGVPVSTRRSDFRPNSMFCSAAICRFWSAIVVMALCKVSLSSIT